MLSILSIQEMVAEKYCPSLCSIERIRLMRTFEKYFTIPRFTAAATMPISVSQVEYENISTR